MRKRKKNIFDTVLLIALIISALLYVLQLWQLINLPLLVILSPVMAAAGFIMSVMLFAVTVALLNKNRHERKARTADRGPVCGSPVRQS